MKVVKSSNGLKHGQFTCCFFKKFKLGYLIVGQQFTESI